MKVQQNVNGAEVGNSIWQQASQ